MTSRRITSTDARIKVLAEYPASVLAQTEPGGTAPKGWSWPLRLGRREVDG